MKRDDYIDALVKSLKEFAALCPWLEQQQEKTEGEIFGTFDEEVLLTGEVRSQPGVTAGMIRRARKAAHDWETLGRYQ